MGRRDDGSIRKLPSGRWQVRIWDPDTGKHVSLGTFPTKTDANNALADAVSSRARGTWVDPRAGEVTVGTYVQGWIATNPKIRSDRTRATYTSLRTRHIDPTFGTTAVAKVQPAAVRRWHADITDTVSRSTAAKAYRLLRAALNTAVDEGLIARNPCRVVGGGEEGTPERPTASVAEVDQLVGLAQDDLKLFVLLGAYGSLRFSEIARLTRADIRTWQADGVWRGQMHVHGKGGRRRTVAIPPPIIPDVHAHLEHHVGPDSDARLFSTSTGLQVSGRYWWTRWDSMRRSIGRPDLHFHDLRHTGNVLAARTGATTRQLMNRMGHTTMRAALIYQHASEEADQDIADSLGEIIIGDRSRRKADS